MKTKKEIKSQIIACYQGGTKVRVSLPLDRSAAEAEINNARKEVRDAKLETVEEDETHDNSYIYLTRNGLLFYNISEPVVESVIQLVPAGAIPK